MEKLQTLLQLFVDIYNHVQPQDLHGPVYYTTSWDRTATVCWKCH